MTLKELTALLQQYGITSPVHDRGQHFLLDDGVVEKMVAASGVQPFTRVIEIGPGPGILTAALLARGCEVVAAEIDGRMVTLLRNRFAAEARFRVLQGDVRTFANETLVGAFHEQGTYHVVANLPYGITSDTLLKFLLSSPRPQSMTLMIQREVADRILAKPGDMSALAVFVQTLADVSRVTNVPPNAFFPPPKVSSTVIHINRKDDHYVSTFLGSASRELYFRLVRTGFSARRKMLKNTLASIESDLKKRTAAFAKAEISQTARPEELSIEEWRRLATEFPR